MVVEEHEDSIRDKLFHIEAVKSISRWLCTSENADVSSQTTGEGGIVWIKV